MERPLFFFRVNGCIPRLLLKQCKKKAEASASALNSTIIYSLYQLNSSSSLVLNHSFSAMALFPKDCCAFSLKEEVSVAAAIVT